MQQNDKTSSLRDAFPNKIHAGHISTIVLASLLSVGLATVFIIHQQEQADEQECEDHYQEHTEQIEDSATVDRHGRYTFTGPSAQICHVYPRMPG